MIRLAPIAVRPTQTRAELAVRDSVTGVGPRPRLEYTIAGRRRIAIGRRGESADRLRAELVSTYGLVHAIEVCQRSDALAEYVARGGNYRPFARTLKAGHRNFLRMAKDPAEVERAVVLSDRQLDRVWRAVPEYDVPQGSDDVSLGDYGEWVQDTPGEVVVGDPGGELEPSRERPMAIPKSDGRGKEGMYFGNALNYGGGCRWSLLDFEPPLKIPLGGLLNRQLGFGRSTRVDEVLVYEGDGFRWGRNKPLGRRIVDPWSRGPVCRTLEHPEPR